LGYLRKGLEELYRQNHGPHMGSGEGLRATLTAGLTGTASRDSTSGGGIAGTGAVETWAVMKAKKMAM